MDSKKLEKLVKYARLIKASGFLILGKQTEVLTLHIEKLHPREGMNACIAAFVSLVAMDLEKGNYSDAYKNIAKDMVQEYQEMVKKYNAKFLAQVAKENPAPKK